MTTPERSVEEIVEESNKRMMAFEHEPSHWNGMMVYEAGDIEGYHDWLTQTLQTERQKREEVVEAERELSIQVLEEHALNRKRYEGAIISMIDRLKLHYESR